MKTTLLFIFSLLFSIKLSSQVAFYADVSSGCAPLSVNFMNLSDLSVAHCDWFFGDGSSDFDVFNTNHVFNYDGNFTVEMYGYDATYSVLIGVYSVNISVNGPPSYINMQATPVCVGDQVELNTYYSSPTYTWDFGDGTAFTTSDPYGQHVYSSPGTYPVSMGITVPGCGPYIVNGSIDVVTSAPFFYSYVYMGVNPAVVCPTSNVGMYCSPGFQAYSWNFDNGFGGSSTDEVTTYGSIGSYSPSVTITNGCGMDTTLFGSVVVDGSIPVEPIMTYGPNEICLSEEMQFDAYSDNGITYVWDFGDGSPTSNGNYAYHTYASAGAYTATVTVTNACGNTAMQNHVVNVTTNAPVYDPYLQVFPLVVCPNDEISYNIPNYDYYIDFGDGFGQSSGYTHSYATPGTYPVTVILQNTCGSTATLTEYVTVQNNLPVSSNVDIYIYENPSCPNTDVEFSSSSGFSQYHWTFGDGTSSNYHEVGHPYSNAGTYPISVTITNGCGNDTTLFSSVQIANNLPISYMDFAVFGDAICTNDIIYMSTEQGAQLDYVWDFGDGNSSTDAYASHVYGVNGVYTITLTATNGCGNDSTVSQAVTVGGNIPVNPAMLDLEIQTPGCIGDNLYFAVVPAGIGTYAWNFGDGNSGFSDQLLFVNEQPIALGTHSYNNTGVYNAQLTITNGCGNTFDTTVVVTIGSIGDNTPVDVFFWQNQFEPTCQGLPVSFQAVGAGTYVWDFGDGTGSLVTYSSFTPVNHVFENDGYFNITVTGYNQCGNSDIGNQTIYIPNSKITVVTNAVQNSDCGEENGVAIVSASGGAQPYTYAWTNGDDGVIADSLGSGIYTIAVTDNNGCHSEGLAAVSDTQGPIIVLDNILHNGCYGQSNGVIAVSIFGGAPPYTISWSNGAVTEDIYNLVSGPYEIFVTDANGCFAAKSYTVNQPQKSIVSILTNPADCGSSNGTATAAISNGVAPFNYIWPSGTSSSNTTSGLAPGMHTLLVIDGNTCLLQKEFVVNETNSAIIVVDSIVQASCAGILSAVYINTIAGVSPFTYTWSNGTSNQDLIGVLPGQYNVEVEGANGCSSYMIFDLIMETPDKPGICIVTVDTLTNSNLVVWSPDPSPDVVSYNIYKESSLNGLYYLVNNQSATNISQYYDYLSNPSIKSWRYKVTSVDNCGNESDFSDPHKTIHLTSNLGVSGVVNLIWDHYNGFNYSTYYINRYHPSTGWMVIDSVGSSAISYTDLTPPSDSNLIYVIAIYPPSVCTASKAQDHNSSRSNKSGINYPDLDNSGIAEVEPYAISIYPNPTSGIVQVSYTAVILSVKVYDLSGKLVYQLFNNNTNKLPIDFSQFSDGIYTAEIETEEGMIRSKIVKQ